jgi:hypothetical protein
VVSSGSYAPWPFANQQPGDIVGEGPLSFSAAGQPPIGGQITTEAMSANAGYARLQLRRQGGSLALRATFASSTGATVQTRWIPLVATPAPPQPTTPPENPA